MQTPHPMAHSLLLPPALRRLGWCALIAGLCSAAGPLAAADIDGARTDLARVTDDIAAQEDEVRAKRAEAARLADELAQLRAEQIAIAGTAQEHEAEIAGIEQKLAELGVEAAAGRAALETRVAASTGTAMALARLARRPAYAALVLPGEPADLLRGGLLLRAALPQLEAEAARLRAEIARLAANESEQAERRGALAAATAQLEQERARLAEIAPRKEALLGETRAAQRLAAQRIEELVREAQDLNDLLGRLETLDRERQEAEVATDRAAEAQLAARRAEEAAHERAAAEAAERRQERLAAIRPLPRPAQPAAPRPISQAHGALAAPAEGRLLVAYGERTGFGAAKGITLATLPRAQVVAPYAGRVAFSGPFRQFGLILIIEHGEGYHSLLAGLARVDAAVGQWVLTGEPVGVTGEAEDESIGGRSPEGRTAGAPTLYVELRRKGQPIDPRPWLAGNNDKVRG